MVALLMSFLTVPLFTLISYYLLLHLGFCKAYQNCLVALIKITTVLASKVANNGQSQRLPYSYTRRGALNVLSCCGLVENSKPKAKGKFYNFPTFRQDSRSIFRAVNVADNREISGWYYQ